ncbi:AEC family transporter [Tessaracoccus lubricantis]|uniref:AEC family transporter n=1 Tax=Tessaracoccus lubricantis TaxID=545543 RepID=A0ABP9FIX9_9ACTN
MWAAVEGFTTIGIVVAVGYLLARVRITGRSAQRSLGDVAFFVGQPALVLVAVAGADLDLLFGRHVLAFGLACVLTGLTFAALMVRRWGATRAEGALGYLATSYVNAGNLGISIAAYVLGDAAWAAPAMLLQVLVLQPTAVAVLESSPAGRGRSVVRSFLTHPLVLGGMAGLVLNLTSWQPPAVLWDPLVLMAELGIPAMLLAFGMSFHSTPLPRLGRLPRLTLAAIATKSLVVPAVALGLALLLGLTGTPLRAAVVLAALPTAQVVFVHAMRYRTALPLVQATTLWSTLLSVPVIVAAGAFLT